MPVDRIAARAAVNDDGSVAFDIAGHSYTAASVADAIEYFRGFARDNSCLVDAEMVASRGGAHHVFVQPDGGLSHSEPTIVGRGSNPASAAPGMPAGASGADALPPRPQHLPGEKTQPLQRRRNPRPDQEPALAGAPESETTAPRGDNRPSRTRDDASFVAPGTHTWVSSAQTSDSQAAGPPIPPGTATPYSGPAVADRKQRSRGKRSKTPQERPPRHRISRKRARVALLIGSIALIVVAVAAFVMPRFIGSPQPTDPVTIQQNVPNPVSTIAEGRSDAPVPGFSADPAWRAEVPATASTTATKHGVLVVDGNSLKVYNTSDGKERYSGDIPENAEVSFAVDTQIEGETALVWRIDSKVYALFEGERDVTEYDLPASARLSSAGTSILIKSGNSLSTLGKEDLKELPTPGVGVTPMALDGDTLVSAEFDGPVILHEPDGARNIELEKPEDDLHIIRWVSAGHGLVVTLWGGDGADINTGHPVQLVVHSLEDGSITSTVATGTDEVGEAEWTRGQGFQLASIGPYLFSMTDGLLVHDGTKQNISFGMSYGQIATGTWPAGNIKIIQKTAYANDSELLAVIEGGPAIVRTNAEEVTAYGRD